MGQRPRIGPHAGRAWSGRWWSGAVERGTPTASSPHIRAAGQTAVDICRHQDCLTAFVQRGAAPKVAQANGGADQAAAAADAGAAAAPAAVAEGGGVAAETVEAVLSGATAKFQELDTNNDGKLQVT